ncbi:MAG: hypothetical protein ACKO3P_16570, partial [Planctomycetaceae bacterium]
MRLCTRGEQKSGDSWKNYAWRWALCHLLANNPNYSPRFRPLGVALLTGQRTGFDNVYGSLLPEIEFEYREFLKQLDSGLRVDLTAWNWQAKFKAPSARSNTKARVEAGRGWQPSRLTLRAGDQLTYACTGEWKLGQGGDPVSADGGPAGRGKLLGVLLLDEGDRYQLGEPFELGSTGQFTAPTAGRLYLRCQDRWTELANNSGFVTVELQLAQEAEEGTGLKESPPEKTPPTKSLSGKSTPGDAPPAPASSDADADAGQPADDNPNARSTPGQTTADDNLETAPRRRKQPGAPQSGEGPAAGAGRPARSAPPTPGIPGLGSDSQPPAPPAAATRD